ncbi:MAG TPA: hypothetical protein P5239_07105, partial [Victivallales bacterium]|nr:hypothetical protein [Victivallales bacterium]
PSHVLRVLDFILDNSLNDDQIKMLLQFLAKVRVASTKNDKNCLEEIMLRIKGLVRKYANIDMSIAKDALSLMHSFAINPFAAKSLILYDLIVQERSESVLFFSLKNKYLHLLLNNHSEDLPVYNFEAFKYLKELLIHSKNEGLVVELAKFSVSPVSFAAYTLNKEDILNIYTRFENSEENALKQSLLSVLHFVLHSQDITVLETRDRFELVNYLSNLLKDQDIPVKNKNAILSHLAYSAIFNNGGLNELERFLFDTKDTNLTQSCIYNLIHIAGTSQDHYSVTHSINLLMKMLPKISNENLNVFCVSLMIQEKILAKDEKTFLQIRRALFSEIQKRIISQNSEDQSLLYSCLDDSLFGNYKKKQRRILILNILKNEKDELTSKAIMEMLKNMLNINKEYEITFKELKQAISSMPDDPLEEEIEQQNKNN